MDGHGARHPLTFFGSVLRDSLALVIPGLITVTLCQAIGQGAGSWTESKWQEAEQASLIGSILCIAPCLPLVRLIKVILLVLTDDLDRIATTWASYLGVVVFSCCSIGSCIAVYASLSAFAGTLALAPPKTPIWIAIVPACRGWVGGCTLGAGVVAAYESRRLASSMFKTAIWFIKIARYRSLRSRTANRAYTRRTLLDYRRQHPATLDDSLALLRRIGRVHQDAELHRLIVQAESLRQHPIHGNRAATLALERALTLVTAA